MASPNTLALRKAQSGLRVREIPVEMPLVEPSTHVPVAVEMRRRSYLGNIQREQRIAATNRGRDIPVGGPGRRRAKAQRRKSDTKTCITRHDGQRCTERAIDGTVRCRLHTRPSPHMLADVLAYCDAHPHDGPLPPSQPMTLYRHDDGKITVEEVPDVLNVSVPLLDSDLLRGLTFTDGVLTIHTSLEPLRYRPLGRCPAAFAIRFQRITGPWTRVRGRQYDGDAIHTSDWVVDQLRQDIADTPDAAARFKRLLTGEWRDVNEAAA